MLEHSLAGYKPKLGPWRTDTPEKVGWYLGDHKPGSWVYDKGVFVFWNGETWKRPFGWPSDTQKRNCMVLCSDIDIRFPEASQEYLISQCASLVDVIRWCGLAVEPK